MFGFKKKEVIIYAPLTGEVVSIAKVNDPTFAESIVGPGVAIKPGKGRVVAPAEARVSLMFETGHAVSLVAEGAELLIHVGLDTVRLKGAHFTKKANGGDMVSKGDILMEFDPVAISAAGFDTITPVVVCNPDDFKAIHFANEGPVKEGDPLIILTLK